MQRGELCVAASLHCGCVNVEDVIHLFLKELVSDKVIQAVWESFLWNFRVCLRLFAPIYSGIWNTYKQE